MNAADWRLEFIRKTPGQHLFDEPLAAHTTFRVGGPADLFARPENTDALAEAVAFLSSEGIRFIVIGGGSNLLFSDNAFRGAVLRAPSKTADGNNICIEGTKVIAAAGVSLQRLVTTTAAAGLSGLEKLAGIPGSAGGALFMNAGAFGRAISDSVVNVTFCSPDKGRQTLSRDELGFEYRKSAFQNAPEMTILEAAFDLNESWDKELLAIIKDIITERRAKQPPWTPCAGSFFKNPPGTEPAGRLIDKLGLKGASVGGAKVSEHHANFIVNTGGATCADILALSQIITRRVMDTCGVALEREVRLVV